MKLIEKLAEEWTDPFSADGDKVPYSSEFIDLIEAGYIAGFRKAREMAENYFAKASLLENNSDASGAYYFAMKWIAQMSEEEVE